MFTINPGDIISIKSPNSSRYFISIILTPQVLFGGNLCASFSIPQDRELTYTEFLEFQEKHQWKYEFIDFHDALQDNTLSKIHTGFPVDEIFCGEIKQKEFLEEFVDPNSMEMVLSQHNDRERIEEKEIEGFFSDTESTLPMSLTPILAGVFSPTELIEGDTKDVYGEDLDIHSLLAYHEQIMKDERYFYGFRKIDKIKYTPHALVKPKAQTEREKLIPEISLNTYPIYQYIQLYEK